MKFLKIALLSLLSLILVNKNYCVPISDKNEVLEYLQHFGYLSENDKNKISNDHERLEDDDQFITAIKHLQVSEKKNVMTELNLLIKILNYN